MCELVDRLLAAEKASGKRRAEALRVVGEKVGLSAESVKHYAAAARWCEGNRMLAAAEAVERRLQEGTGVYAAIRAVSAELGLSPRTVEKAYYWRTTPANGRRGKRPEGTEERNPALKAADAGDLEAAVLELAGRYPRRVPQSEIEAVAKRFEVGVITVMSLLGDLAKKGTWQTRLAELEAELGRLREENVELRRRAEAAEAELERARRQLGAARAALDEIRRAVLAA
ncbi:MAG: hypothetical protein K6U89_14050 [Chloroflexi bacterium]|nr:hypothetical protein [Chloroflexota bacterium]